MVLYSLCSKHSRCSKCNVWVLMKQSTGTPAKTQWNKNCKDTIWNNSCKDKMKWYKLASSPARPHCGETFVSLCGHKLESSPQRLNLPKTRKIPGFLRQEEFASLEQQMIPPPPPLPHFHRHKSEPKVNLPPTRIWTQSESFTSTTSPPRIETQIVPQWTWQFSVSCQTRKQPVILVGQWSKIDIDHFCQIDSVSSCTPSHKK